MLGSARPPSAQGGMGQSNPTFAPNMVPVLQARPGSSPMGQPYQGQLGAAGMPASSFMPVIQQQGRPAQASAPHMSSMQPLVQNGALFPSNTGQGFQFGSNMPQFQPQQQLAQQQHMQQPAHFGGLSSNQQTQSGYNSTMAGVSPGQSAPAQNV